MSENEDEKNKAFESLFSNLVEGASPERAVELIADKEYLRVWYDNGFWQGRYGENGKNS